MTEITPLNVSPENQPEDKPKGDRVAKLMARAGLCSRRDAERWIAELRVEVDGVIIDTPATIVDDPTRIKVDGQPLPASVEPKLWLYHKPAGLVTTHKDEDERPTVFEHLPEALGRVISVGRLDMNSEGLLLLTNDGGLARELELPQNGWLRTYRVRVFGFVTQDILDTIKKGCTVEGIHYGPVDAHIEKKTGRNAWLIISLSEGKNREIRQLMRHLDLHVNRLIRHSFGPFRLGDLKREEVMEVPRQQLIKQLGGKFERAAEDSGIIVNKSQKGWAKAKDKPNAKPKTPRKSRRPKPAPKPRKKR
ncbi:MAG: rRNA pseudouridine synthase [Magnetovibrio sp.]|nr:rRNA pseudouridine synthase [Magnetovibrio sp.]